MKYHVGGKVVLNEFKVLRDGEYGKRLKSKADAHYIVETFEGKINSVGYTFKDRNEYLKRNLEFITKNGSPLQDKKHDGKSGITAMERWSFSRGDQKGYSFQSCVIEIEISDLDAYPGSEHQSYIHITKGGKAANSLC